MNINVFFLISTSLNLLGSAGNAKNEKKDIFLQAAFDFENQIRSELTFNESESLDIDEKLIYKAYNSGIIPYITYSNDAIYEMFRLMKISTQVCANTSSNPERLGGWFKTLKNFREGRGLLEESVFSIFNGYLLSLENCAKKDEEQVIKGDPNIHSYMYKKSTLERKILYSQDLYPRIPKVHYDNYATSKEGYDSFSEYLEQKFSEGIFKFGNCRSEQIALYTIPAIDRRKIKGKFDYPNLKHDTYLKISVMLNHARTKGYKMIVITIPGSDMFSKIQLKDISKNNKKYLTSVEKGTEDAIRNYGRGFEEIVICGHRYRPEIEIKLII